MGTEVSPEPIDFDFFAKEDDHDDEFVRNSRRRKSPLTTPPKQSNVTGSRRPESASSARSGVSSRSSISIKLPSAGPTGERENSYTIKGSYSDSSDEEYINKDRSDRFQTRKNDQNSNVQTEREFKTRTSLRRPKTSKGPRSHKRHDSSSSHSSKSTCSSKSDKSSVSSKSDQHNQSDSYTSVSDSESDDVTDVSPLPSPARSSTPVLEYNQDEFEDSFEENKFREAKSRPRVEHSRRDGKHNQRRAVKEGVRFAGVTPGNRSATQRDKHLDETEARELSQLLRAVLELDETPNHSQLQHSLSKQQPASYKKSPHGSTTEAMPHNRVNLSFSNDKVKDIDRENQRLLQKILKRPKSGYAGSVSPSVRRWDEPPRMVSHSAICRQREQRKIEMENMKILQRIEAVHACSSIQRDKLIQEHSKQTKYASQVTKGTIRPQSSRPYNYGRTGTLSKGSSTASLKSNATHSSSTRSTGSRKNHGRPSSSRSAPPPPRTPRTAWDDRW